MELYPRLLLLISYFFIKSVGLYYLLQLILVKITVRQVMSLTSISLFSCSCRIFYLFYNFLLFNKFWQLFWGFCISWRTYCLSFLRADLNNRTCKNYIPITKYRIGKSWRRCFFDGRILIVSTILDTFSLQTYRFILLISWPLQAFFLQIIILFCIFKRIQTLSIYTKFVFLQLRRLCFICIISLRLILSRTLNWCNSIFLANWFRMTELIV